MKILLAEVNISEGKDKALLSSVEKELLSVEGLEIMEINSDADHNRTVYTYKGEPQNVLEGTKKLVKKAVELIDMTKHKGSHPRMGAVDVVPFIPVKNVTLEEAVEVAKDFGKYLGSLGVPVYYYEDAAKEEYRKNLVAVRKGEYEGLEEKMKLPEWAPDEGPKAFVPKSGGTVTGARFPLIAFNVNLQTTNLEVGKKIVKAIRGATGGYQCVRGIALELKEKNLVQVSMNLINYEKTPIHRVFETVKSEAASYGVSVHSTELVGPLPLYALEELLRFYIHIENFSMEQVYI